MLLNRQSLEDTKFASKSGARPVLSALCITPTHVIATDASNDQSLHKEIRSYIGDCPYHRWWGDNMEERMPNTSRTALGTSSADNVVCAGRNE